MTLKCSFCDSEKYRGAVGGKDFSVIICNDCFLTAARAFTLHWLPPESNMKAIDLGLKEDGTFIEPTTTDAGGE